MEIKPDDQVFFFFFFSPPPLTEPDRMSLMHRKKKTVDYPITCVYYIYKLFLFPQQHNKVKFWLSWLPIFLMIIGMVYFILF